MLRPWLAVAFIIIPLAGCSTGPDAESPSPSVTPSSTPSSAPLPQVVVTDTMHLLEAPHMAGRLPDAGTLIRTPVPSDMAALPARVEPVSWRIPRPEVADLLATLHLVVEVQGTAAPYSYSALGASSGACFWNVVLHFEGDDFLEQALASACVPELGTVPTGIRTLEFRLMDMGFGDLQDNRPILLGLYVTGVYGQGTTVDVLSGTLEHDSTLTVENWQLPVDTQTLTH